MHSRDSHSRFPNLICSLSSLNDFDLFLFPNGNHTWTCNTRGGRKWIAPASLLYLLSYCMHSLIKFRFAIFWLLILRETALKNWTKQNVFRSGWFEIVEFGCIHQHRKPIIYESYEFFAYTLWDFYSILMIKNIRDSKRFKEGCRGLQSAPMRSRITVYFHFMPKSLIDFIYMFGTSLQNEEQEMGMI